MDASRPLLAVLASTVLGLSGLSPALATTPSLTSSLCGPLPSHTSLAAPKPKDAAQGRQFLPIYSAIRYLHNDLFSVAVTISLRNPNPTLPLDIPSALLVGNQGEPLKDFIEQKPITIPPLGTAELFLRNIDFPQHSGASMIIAWEGPAKASPPLTESVMVGSKGSQGMAFNSRAIELPACP